MATSSTLRKFLHRKGWEMAQPSVGPNQAVNTVAGSFCAADKFNIVPGALAFFVNSASGIYRYDGEEDAWLQLPNSGIAGAFGAGACGEFRGLGAMGGVFTQTATAGTTSTITTSRTIVRLLNGRRIRVVSGTGIGYDGTIASNTIGPNSVITVSTPNGVAFDATTQFQVYSGSLWFFNAGTSAVGFSVFDLATNAWTARSVSGLPTAWGTDGQLVSTIGAAGSFATGTSTGTNTSTTLTNTGKAWGVNMWANYQVRITSGTGIGQIRVITSNTATALTVASAWTVTPDATSQYAIEGNDDAFYLLGNNAVTIYTFTVSTNTWATITPGSARGGAAGGGASASWIDSVEGWDNGTLVPLYSSTLYKQNGRYILSFRGGASSTLDVFDIAARTWISNVPYGNQAETFTTGTSSVDCNGAIYLQKDAVGRFFRFDVATWTLMSLTANPIAQSTVGAGQKMFLLQYYDGGDKLTFLYAQRHSGNELYRMLLF